MENADSLDGWQVVVSGGSGALGAAVVASFVERGASVTVLDRFAPKPFSARERVHAMQVDLTDERAVTAAFAGLRRLDASIHCAGGFDMKAIAETSLADLDAMWRMNAASCFLACREAVRAMRRTREMQARDARAGGRSKAAPAEATPGAAPQGWIVNVAARPALQPAGGMLAYSMSKAAVANLTQSLAAEVLAEGILVNAIVPSIMDTPANRRAMPTADHSKWPRVEEVARVIRALASPSNRTTSGALVPVYGAA
ncbi:MAG: SDR family NAD(P)-dependent oxidoreductase [Phycisphaerae bacterium]|nr:SDR family NAD(P)-dependent oxidoreductase [Phycisphaerae bacterium]